MSMRRVSVPTHAGAPSPGDFPSEAALVEALMNGLRGAMSLWGLTKTAAEFDYASGRTDVIALTGENELIAFEAKLTRWRDALNQAFRNTFFAHRSYVVLPVRTAAIAARYAADFARRRTGLCSVSDNAVNVILPAPSISCPVQPWLAAHAADMIRRGNELTQH